MISAVGGAALVERKECEMSRPEQAQNAPNTTADTPGAPPHERIINVRKLAAIDLVFHGPRFILIEFGAGIPLMLALGVFILWRASALTGAAFIGYTLLGAYMLSLAANYLPLLFYAVALIRRGDAAAVVAYEVAHKETYAPRYGAQQMLLLLPLVIPALALWQAWQARQRR
jgi:hypothetical protein